MKLMTSLVLGLALIAAPLAACDSMGGPHAQKSSISKEAKKSAQIAKKGKAKAKVANLTQDKQAKI